MVLSGPRYGYPIILSRLQVSGNSMWPHWLSSFVYWSQSGCQVIWSIENSMICRSHDEVRLRCIIMMSRERYGVLYRQPLDCLFNLPAWWALWLLWWPLTDAAMFQCVYGYLQSVFFFLVLFHCCILLEIKLTTTTTPCFQANMKEIIKGPYYWPFVRGIHRWPMFPLTKGQ